MIFIIIIKSTCVRFGCQTLADAFYARRKKAPPMTGPIKHLELVLFASEIRRAFFEKGSDAFPKIVGFARFDLAFVFEG